MKKLLVLSAFGALALGGCAQFDSIVATLSSPATTQAIANLKSGATVLICAVADSAAVAAKVESAVNAGNALQATNGKVLVASATVCDALGGAVTAKTVVP